MTAYDHARPFIAAKPDWYATYASASYREELAQDLIVFAKRVFEKAAIVRAIPALYAMHAQDNVAQEFQNLCDELVYEAAIDDVRITMCMENMMKAELIRGGYIVHFIAPHGRWKMMGFDPAESPVSFNALLQAEFEPKNIKNKTIGMNIMLEKQDYIAAIGLPSDILPFVVDLNTRRNHLHLHQTAQQNFGKAFLDLLSKVKDYVDHA